MPPTTRTILATLLFGKHSIWTPFFFGISLSWLQHAWHQTGCRCGPENLLLLRTLSRTELATIKPETSRPAERELSLHLYIWLAWTSAWLYWLKRSSPLSMSVPWYVLWLSWVSIGTLAESLILGRSWTTEMPASSKPIWTSNLTTMSPIDTGLCDLASQDAPNISAIAKRPNVDRSMLSRRWRGKTGSWEQHIDSMSLLTKQQQKNPVCKRAKGGSKGREPSAKEANTRARE